LIDNKECSETKIHDRKANRKIERLNLMAKSNRKCHEIIDF
jgi:hypothetical protein